MTFKLDDPPQLRHDVRPGQPVTASLQLGAAHELAITCTGSLELESVCDIEGQFVIDNPTLSAWLG
ncbi:hypothetical protein [Amycolatopsis sp. FDAARGOS 1241]|uniref:hypothetical protein n=1 Tax=Amycolatopsis sp. FDAARGOS 1241 TaxID=2778070 RepID=UPI00195194E7|nr:hypothetical protein [Amycolatopsis sp. FDAARGOS 1241]QRP46447.1 hypothetical protein I6J71_46915 [Amycolatopsis sp. FDAARGOS 1241]